jgi:hypothetical protein
MSRLIIGSESPEVQAQSSRAELLDLLVKPIVKMSHV